MNPIQLNEAQKRIILAWSSPVTGKSDEDLERFALAILANQSAGSNESPTIAQMTIRDCFAAHAMQSILLYHSKNRDLDETARKSYEVADAMMAQRAKGQVKPPQPGENYPPYPEDR